MPVGSRDKNTSLSCGLSCPGQQPGAPDNSANPQAQTDPLAELSPENRALFDNLRQAAQQNDDAATVAAGKKLLTALKLDSSLIDFVTELTAGSAIETGETADALTLLKPFSAVHPDDWRTASHLARA